MQKRPIILRSLLIVAAPYVYEDTPCHSEERPKGHERETRDERETSERRVRDA